MTRTYRMINSMTGKTLYESTCTINGNDVTGCINPFPYMKRKIRKMGLRIVNIEETDNTFVLCVA